MSNIGGALARASKTDAAIAQLPTSLRKPHVVYGVAAALFIAGYTEVELADGRDPSLTRSEPREGMSDLHTMRVRRLGASVYALRSHPGFDHLCSKATKQLRSASHELFAAYSVAARGCEIHARPEQGKLSQDFDVFALAFGEKLNVEVTAFTKEAFSEDTLRRALLHKRTQLPSDDPAAIICFIPQTWFDGEISEAIDPVIKEFLRRTGRINCVEVWSENETLFGDKGTAYEMHWKRYLNPKPRNQSRIISELLLDDDFVAAEARFEAHVDRILRDSPATE